MRCHSASSILTLVHVLVSYRVLVIVLLGYTGNISLCEIRNNRYSWIRFPIGDKIQTVVNLVD